MSTQPKAPKSNSGGNGAAQHLGSHPGTVSSGHCVKCYANSFTEKGPAELFLFCLFVL